MNQMGQDTLFPGSVSSADRAGPARVRLGECLVEVDLDRVVTPQGATALEPKTMAVLAHLIEHAGEVVSAEQLIEAVWHGRPMGDNPVYRCIAQLRRALGDNPRAPTCIATVPTKGYRLIAAVELVEPQPLQPAKSDESQAPSSTDPKRAVPPSHRRALVALLVLVLTLVAVMTVLRSRGSADFTSSPGSGSVTLAVLPWQSESQDQAGILLAESVTDVIRHRLARLHGLIVVADRLAAPASTQASNPAVVAQQLHARFLMRGKVLRVDERLHVNAQLLDGQAGTLLWSVTLDRPISELASIRDDIARHIAEKLSITIDQPAAPNAGEGAINLDAYAVYMRGQQILLDPSRSHTSAARELFRRATVLDANFARAYLGLGQALLREADADPGPAAETRSTAAKAFDRALELDPELGEAWVGRARNEVNQDKADALFHKGLALAPSDVDGYVRYARFLYESNRVGEAINALEHARQIDPLAPGLCLTQAFFVMVVNNDVAAHDRLVRQALAMNPRLPAALQQLAYSHWEYSGKFAQAAQVIGREIAVDPQSDSARMLARDIYLDLGDPAAATAVLGPSPSPLATMELAQYRGDHLGAAVVLKDIPPENWPDRGPQASKVQAIRDAAMDSGDFASALRLLQPVQALHETWQPMTFRGFALVYAHILILAGHTQEGQLLARKTLEMVEADGMGRRQDWFCRERASAYAILGNDKQVLQELAHCIDNGQIYRWWYLAEHDPLYQHLHHDPGFQALNRRANAMLGQQRAELATLRRKGELAAANQPGSVGPVSSRASAIGAAQ